MASPFRIFRKYQKVLIVVAGVILMFVFTIGDVLVQFMGRSAGGSSGGRSAGDVAVRWKDGQLTEGELSDLTARRAVISAFQQQVATAGQMAATQAGQALNPLEVQPVAFNMPERGADEQLVFTRILSREAQQAGMVVSDDAIVRYLGALGRHYVTSDQMKNMLSRLQVGRRRVAIGYIFEALREELLARDYLAAYLPLFRTLTPEQQWAEWRKVHDFLTVEAASIDTNSKLGEVSEPTDEQIDEYFQQYRDREPVPDVVLATALPSPTPGFAIPRRVQLHYVRADYDAVLQRVAAEITDEQVKEYYETYKDALFSAGDASVSEAPTTSPDASDPAASDPPALDTNVAPGSADAGEDTPATSSGSDDESSDIDQPEESSPENGDDEAGEPAANDQTSAMPPGPFRLARYQAEPPAETAADEPVLFGGDAAQASDASSDSVATERAGPADANSSTESPNQYLPLEEVSDQIRRQLAQGQVAVTIERQLSAVRSKLNEIRTKYVLEAGDLEADGKEPPPPPTTLTDLTEIARANDLIYERLKEVSLFELAETEIGTAFVPAEVNRNGGPKRVYQLAFDDTELFLPYHARQIDGNQYVVLKTSDEPRRTPELAEIRDEVVASWKRREAADLALKAAEELAKQAEQAGTPLKEFFQSKPEFEVVTSDSFSWLTRGAVARSGIVQNFRLSQPQPLVAPGPDLMSTVFSLDGDDVRAALNHDRSRAYIVRLYERAETLEQLRENFLQMQVTGIWDGLMATVEMQSSRMQSDLVRNLATSLDIDWKRPPNQRSSDSP